MEYSKELVNDIIIFHVDGELVIGKIKNIYDDVMDLITHKNKFVFNLENCEMLDSSAIGMMVSCYRPQGQEPQKVRLVKANEQIIESIRTMKLDLIFVMYDSMEDAVKSFG